MTSIDHLQDIDELHVTEASQTLYWSLVLLLLCFCPFPACQLCSCPPVQLHLQGLCA